MSDFQTVYRRDFGPKAPVSRVCKNDHRRSLSSDSGDDDESKFTEHWPQPQALTPRCYADYRSRRRDREMRHTKIFGQCDSSGSSDEAEDGGSPDSSDEDEGFSSPRRSSGDSRVPKLALAGALTPSPQLPPTSQRHVVEGLRLVTDSLCLVEAAAQTESVPQFHKATQTGADGFRAGRIQRPCRLIQEAGIYPTSSHARTSSPQKPPFAAYGRACQDASFAQRRSFNRHASGLPKKRRVSPPGVRFAAQTPSKVAVFSRRFFGAPPPAFPASEYQRQFRTSQISYF